MHGGVNQMKQKKTDTVRKTHQQIYEQEHSIVLMMETISEAALLIDPYEEGFPIIFVNRGFTEMTGYNMTEIIGKKYHMLEGKETDKKASQMITEAIKDKKSTTVETLNYRKNGSSFWLETSISPLYNAHGEVYAFIGIQKDITKKKQAPSDEETFFGEHGHHEGFIIFINEAGFHEKTNLNISGLKKMEDENIIGKHVTDFVVEHDKDRVMKSFNRALKGHIENFIIKSHHFNGDIIEINILYLPFHEQGKITGVYAVFRNITGSSETYKLRINAEKYDVARRMGLAMADAIDTSVTTLKGLLQLLIANSSFAPTYTTLMLTEIERIEKSMRGIRRFSKLRMIETKESNLRKLLENICKIMYAPTLQADIHLHLDYQTKKELIKIDEICMEFVFIQLIKNALESMPSGGQILIKVKHQANGMILIQVIDEGESIEKQNLQKIKDAFYTTKEDRVGLALAICKNVVKEHQGSLSIRNREGKGVIAEVLLPAF